MIFQLLSEVRRWRFFASSITRKSLGMMQHLSWCALTVWRAPFELMQLQQFASGVKVTSVRAGYRQVIEVFGDRSREPL